MSNSAGFLGDIYITASDNNIDPHAGIYCALIGNTFEISPMRLVAAPLGLLLALVLAVLAVPQVVTMEATLRPLTSGCLQSLIDRFDLLLLIVVAVIGLGLGIRVNKRLT